MNKTLNADESRYLYYQKITNAIKCKMDRKEEGETGIVSPEELEHAYNNFENELLEYLKVYPTAITERELKVLQNCASGLTYEQIGKVFGVTRERIRQIEWRAIKKLIGNKGFRYYLFLGAEQARSIISFKQDLEESYSKGLNQFRELAKLNHEAEEIIAKYKNIIPSLKENTTIISLEDLDFTSRTYHCLKRAGINTLNDLLKITANDLMKIRNLGKKSLKEIRDRVFEKTGVDYFKYE